MHHHGADRIITSELHKVHTILNQLSTMIHLNRNAETDQLLSKIRDASEMLMQDAPAENAEHMDGITKRRGELAGNIMDIVRYGIPTKQEFIKLRQELHDKTKQILDRGTPATDEERHRGKQLIGMIRSYRAQHPNDPPVVKNLHHAEDSEHRSNAQHAAIAISLQKAGKKPS